VRLPAAAAASVVPFIVASFNIAKPHGSRANGQVAARRDAPPCQFCLRSRVPIPRTRAFVRRRTDTLA
jgi:hypothetical protein